MYDRLLTVALSVVTTLAIVRFTDSSRLAPLSAEAQEPAREIVVDRLVVRKELIVSDTGQPWEAGFEQHEIPRGIVAKSLQRGSNGRDAGTAGLWVRGRLIKSDIDDPFDDRLHAINRDGSIFRAPGHISWSVASSKPTFRKNSTMTSWSATVSTAPLIAMLIGRRPRCAGPG